MIVVDTSVWIDYFNGTDSPETDALDRALVEDIVAIGDLILLEILQGFRRDNDYAAAKSLLTELTILPMLNPQRAISAAEYFRHLRKRGITVRKTADVIIATYCIDHMLPLLFTDRDFLPFVEHLGLQPVTV